MVIGLLISGFFWSLTYILIIIRGFQDRTYGMPFVALCANISWEFIFAFVFPHPKPQLYVNYIWFLLDCIIFWQFLRYWRSDPPIRGMPERFFIPVVILTLIGAFSIILLISQEFNDMMGRYAAYGQNLLMSILFINMFLRREKLLGQSFYIALCKLLGTLAVSLTFFVLRPTAWLFDFLYISILLCDSIYLVAVYRRSQQLGLNPWRDVFRRRSLQGMVGAA
jgi:hypothetical protein